MPERSPAISSVQQTPGQLVHWERDQNKLLLRCDNGVLLFIHVITDRLLRFRYSPEGFFQKDFSYAIDPDYHPDIPPIQVIERERTLRIRTRKLECRIKKKDLTHQIIDLEGNLVLADDKGFHWEKSERGGNLVFMSKAAHHEECYFGLGDKSSPLNLRGERMENWAMDCFGYGIHTDPLYRAIPFYYGLRESQAYGVFFDNSFHTYFDFAQERDDATSFWAHGGEMNYYVMFGPGLMDVAEQYARLTGTPELPPLWAMGFHQCRWSYYPESRVKEIATEFRDRKIPCDAIYLDIDYMDGYRCFTWDKQHFPDPARMIRELKAQGFRTVVIIDPGIKIDPDYPVFQEGLKKEVFVRHPDGDFAMGKVWPGECFFPDYTNPEVRAWWSGLFREIIRKMDVDGVWNDMNEPAVFDVESRTLPLEVRHDYDGNPCSHRKAHNVYGMQMARATYDGVKQFAYPKRPFMITRASYAGGQRFSAVWTGDNIASWDHVQLANTQCQRLSISGFSFVGSDIGGFNDYPTGEMFVRWLQAGIFHPLCRVHTMGYHDSGAEAVDEDSVMANMQRNSTTDQEPWSFGEPYTRIARETIELRYQLLPHLYTAMWQYCERGTPVLRPLAFLDQEDLETLHRMEEFTAGDHLLVCPISDPGVEGRFVYLPKGLWYDFRTDQPLSGEQEVWSDASLEHIPMFVRGGAVLSLGPVMQYTGEKPVEVMTLHVYHTSGSEKSELYMDAGEGYAYVEDGAFSLRHYMVDGSFDHLNVRQRIEGSYKGALKSFRIVLHGMAFSIGACQVDGESAVFFRKGTVVELNVPAEFEELSIVSNKSAHSG